MADIEIHDPYHREGSKWRTIKRVLLGSLVLFLALILIAAAILWYNLSKLSINPLAFGPLASDSGRTNILLLGVGDPGHSGQNLSDSIMVISINHTTHEAAFISVPRDLRVNVPDYGYGKINTANADGGPKLAEQTVSNTLGIPIQYYMKTDFSGLKKAVDAVGGIDVMVKDRLTDPEYPCANDENSSCGIDIKPGNYHMNGALALEYARCRKGTCGNDFGRAARQQEVIQKLKDKVFSPGVYLNPATDAALISALGSGSQTDMTVNNLIEVGWDLKRAKRTINFVYSTAPGGFLTDAFGSSDLVPLSGDFSDMQDYARNIFSEPNPTKTPTQ